MTIMPASGGGYSVEDLFLTSCATGSDAIAVAHTGAGEARRVVEPNPRAGENRHAAPMGEADGNAAAGDNQRVQDAGLGAGS